MKLEDKLQNLEDVAEKLADKTVDLNEAIRLYEQGVALIWECMDMLNESKGKIETIRGELDGLLQENEGETI